MAAFQTYQADQIRDGYRAHRSDHKGVVVTSTPGRIPETVSLVVACETHGRNETWKNIPRHAAVHAERTL